MANVERQKRQKRFARHRRVRARLRGTALTPRLSVFRSQRFLWAQLIDDDAGRTLLQVSERRSPAGALKPLARARALGEQLAERAKAAGVLRVVFDRGGYAYHGRVAAFAEGARAGGLQF